MDTGNLYGALEFYEACRQRGIKPIIGAELTCPRTGRHVGVIALSRDGYANLCRVISDVNLDRDLPLVDSIDRSPAGLAVLCPDVASALALGDTVGRERVWVEVIVNRVKSSAVRDILTQARRRGLKTLASWDVLFLNEPDQEIARALKSVAVGDLFAQVGLGVRHASLRACQSLKHMFAGQPDLLAETARLADMADLSLETGKPHFPHARPTPEESLARLSQLCRQALSRKYQAAHQGASARLADELRVIERLGLADYFLVVKDIVDFAVGVSIPVTGRGSGAGSLVAFLLGITQVDPLEQGLLFERFLNEHRPDYPDLDIDISWRRRDEVIDYAYKRFGTSNVAMISTHACFELRSAAREVAKAFGLSPYEAQSVAGRLPYRGTKDGRQMICRVLGEIKPELPAGVREAIGRLAVSIVGFPHHLSVHCGGVVISDRPITYYTPLELAPKGIQVTQFDMRSIEKIGLIKIDLLGNRALTVIEEAERDVEQTQGLVVGIKPDDRKTARVLRTGKTLSCFQLESPAMRGLLAMLKASNRDDASLALALVRPGPSAGGMKHEFIRRRSGAARRPGRMTDVGVLSDGLPVYEEDAMRMISRFTGTSLAEADIFRRELKEGKIGRDELRGKFMFLAETAGIDTGEAQKAWDHVSRFAAYTFCKAHAASYGVLAYASAYLKANFPLEFYAATLRNHAGMYPLWAHVNEARRLGIAVLVPDVNRSKVDFSIENGVIRTGFNMIKHLASKTIERIITEREQNRFTSFTDFLGRVPVTREEVAGLISSGAFDDIEPHRCSTLARYLSTKGKVPLSEQPGLGLVGGVPRLPTREFTSLQKRRMEYTSLGFSPVVHPLEFFICPRHSGEQGAPGGGVRRGRTGTTSEVAPCSGGLSHDATTAVGLLAAMRHYKSNGSDLYFLTLDHPAGLRECVLPTPLRSSRFELGRAYAVHGQTRRRFGVGTLRATAIETLAEKPI